VVGRHSLRFLDVPGPRMLRERVRETRSSLTR
jgi:hypothetical protein